jgi:hypothetical protein
MFSKFEIAAVCTAVGMIIGTISAGVIALASLFLMIWLAIRIIYREAIRTLERKPGDRRTLFHVAARAYARTPLGRRSAHASEKDAIDFELVDADVIDVDENVIASKMYWASRR